MCSWEPRRCRGSGTGHFLPFRFEGTFFVFIAAQEGMACLCILCSAFWRFKFMQLRIADWLRGSVALPLPVAAVYDRRKEGSFDRRTALP
jgi:hypothetical protein